MGTKAKVEKFETINKAQIRGKVGHSRTGACTSQGRCFHGFKPRLGGSGIKSKKSRLG